jgi:hypothetical protein
MRSRNNRRHGQKYKKALRWIRQNNVRTEYKRGRIRVYYKDGDEVKSSRNLLQIVEKMKKDPDRYLE